MDHAETVRSWFGDDGLAHEHWGVVDLMAMMQQLGAVTEGPPA